MASRVKIAVLGVAVVVTGLSISAPASAGFLDRIFGGIRDAMSAPPRPPSNVSSFADPFSALSNALGGNRREPAERRADTGGPSKGFCVRTCDGKFFPVQTRPGMSAAESCNSFCPATQTKIFSGSNIDTAVASDGTRYDNLDSAFSFREKLVAGCTCNGKTPGGLASMDVNKDPTLRPGDIVATKTGLVAFTGANNTVANFTPIDSYRGLPQSARDKLSDVKIMPPTPGHDELTTATVTPVTDRPRTNGRNTQAWR
ncbi:MAG TPA: DUF2865 domain-containing protein [Pseudolabrys sp.]